MPIEGTLEDPDEIYGPNNMGVPGISKKGNFTMKLCLSKSNAHKILIYECTYQE